MNTPKRSVGRRLVAALGVAALSLAGAVGITTAANAATNIPTGTGSIHITKLVQPSVAGSAATGEKNASISGRPVKGVQYTLYRANLQLTSSNAVSTADWTTIDNISKLVQAGYVPSTPTAGTVTIGSLSSTPSTITLNHLTKVGETATTDEDGLADFTDLAPDLYLVVESLPAAGTTPPVTSTAAPFFVSIPLPVSTTVAPSGWLSDVYVYPKNPTSTKTVDDGDALGAGDVFPWTVTAQIPVTADNEGIGSFTISDSLDSRLVYDSYEVVLSDGTPLVVDTDYTVSVPTGANGGDFSIEFTSTGLTKLANHGGNSVVLTLNTSVTADAKDGSITNTAVVNGHDTTQASTYWGNVKVFKHSEGTSTGLKGAQFKVYTDPDASQEVTFGKDAADNPIRKTFTSGDDGSVIIDALKTADIGSTTYYLKEVQAPDGFVPITDPIPVQVYKGQTTAKALPQTPDNNYVPVANTPRTGPSLPLTGANGQLLALIGGGSLVLLAAGTALVARKRSHQD